MTDTWIHIGDEAAKVVEALRERRERELTCSSVTLVSIRAARHTDSGWREAYPAKNG